MGIYEKVLKLTKDRKNIKTSIRESNIKGRAIVNLHDRETDENYAFGVYPEDIRSAEYLTHRIIERMESEKACANAQTIKKIEKALLIELDEIQKQYILSEGIGYPVAGRVTGKTLAHQIKTLLKMNKREKVVITPGNAKCFSDEDDTMMYAQMYARELQRLSYKLRAEGVEVPEVVINWAHGAKGETEWHGML